MSRERDRHRRVISLPDAGHELPPAGESKSARLAELTAVARPAWLHSVTARRAAVHDSSPIWGCQKSPMRDNVLRYQRAHRTRGGGDKPMFLSPM